MKDAETTEHAAEGTSRRGFLGRLGGVSVGAAAGAAGLGALLGARRAAASPPPESLDASTRADRALQIRTDAAGYYHGLPAAQHATNGDEERYSSRIGSYSKGLPHNDLGEVDPQAFQSLLHALQSGDPQDFENIQLDKGSKLTNPQSGLAFEVEGFDSHQLVQPPAPAFSSAWEAGEMGEVYWQALLRDVSFLDFDSHHLARAAAEDLSYFSDFRGPKQSGRVTPDTLFRGETPGDLTGPAISQFLWLDAPFGALTIDQRMRTTVPGDDYMTDYADWLDVQRGALRGNNRFDFTPRYIRNTRDLAQWVHIDVLFEAYFNALLILFGLGAPVDKGNPYTASKTQIGFGTLGGPNIAALVCEVATRALKAVWYQKWYVHRRLRPEVFAGRVHNHLTGRAQYPIHEDILRSAAVHEVRRKHRTYLLPMAFPEGSPTHPAYGAGHATVAGACVTILKVWFDESWVLPDPVVPSHDGRQLRPYRGSALTVGGELNKLASNVAIGRNGAGVHWRSDATESLLLGEAVALGILRDHKSCLNEKLEGFTLTKFDGTTVVV
jgi:hypothetical protein